MLEAKRCYQLAIESDPEFALAYAGLADALCLISIYGLKVSKGDLELGNYAGLKALKLNGSLAEAHAAMAFVKMIYHWNWRRLSIIFYRPSIWIQTARWHGSDMRCIFLRW